jgi:hypothetical protein
MSAKYLHYWYPITLIIFSLSEVYPMNTESEGLTQRHILEGRIHGEHLTILSAKQLPLANTDEAHKK